MDGHEMVIVDVRDHTTLALAHALKVQKSGAPLEFVTSYPS